MMTQIQVTRMFYMFYDKVLETESNGTHFICSGWNCVRVIHCIDCIVELTHQHVTSSEWDFRSVYSTKHDMKLVHLCFPHCKCHYSRLISVVKSAVLFLFGPACVNAAAIRGRMITMCFVVCGLSPAKNQSSLIKPQTVKDVTHNIPCSDLSGLCLLLCLFQI